MMMRSVFDKSRHFISFAECKQAWRWHPFRICSPFHQVHKWLYGWICIHLIVLTDRWFSAHNTTELDRFVQFLGWYFDCIDSFGCQTNSKRSWMGRGCGHLHRPILVRSVLMSLAVIPCGLYLALHRATWKFQMFSAWPRGKSSNR